MYDLKLSGNATEQNLYLDTILQLGELIHLDVSYTKDETVFDALVLNSKLKISDLMLNFNALPKLVSLDISGRELSDVELLKNFLRTIVLFIVEIKVQKTISFEIHTGLLHSLSSILGNHHKKQRGLVR